MGHAATEEERNSAEDFLRWAGFHEGVVVRRIDKDNVEIGYNSPCKHLKFDEQGKASCGVYEDRPNICRVFPASPNVNCPGFRFSDSPGTEETREKEINDE